MTPKNLEKETRQLWGMSRSQIANIVHGVNTGFTKELEINGVGYRAAVQGKILKLSLGYSHDVDFKIPEDVLVICLGKSTYARCGIIVNVTPLEPGWEGHVTLEFSNTTPLPAKIYANEGVAQFVFMRGNLSLIHI